GDKETETEVLLLEHDVPHQPFSQAVLACLPPPTFSISRGLFKDQAGREDLRALSICSVDPPGCTDIDDALHCKPLDNGNTEVGVHIADVSYFIRPGNALDEEASLRGTTVYLCEKNNDNLKLIRIKKCATTMLYISHDVLNKVIFVDFLSYDVPRLWVSVTLSGHREPRRHLLSSGLGLDQASLTYAEAQLMMDDAGRKDPVTSSLRGLNSLAKILKQRRIQNGALTLASPEVRFHMDSETHDPIDLQTKELKETNSMVEEFMLLANISVAERIVDEFPECALLRSHPAPPPSNYDILVKAAKSKNIEIQVDSAKALAESLDRAAVPGAPPYLNTLLRILATRCMMQAIYFCSSMDPDTHHYGLATAIYTHFTLPIRR
uniref:DIS3 exosome endoribonuclease and 3'-5' exoribonuclease n=1 Tax=Petromyzon marinus TaxID=7757 RepID=S4RXG7_PETMA